MTERVELTGWGLTMPTAAEVRTPTTPTNSQRECSTPVPAV